MTAKTAHVLVRVWLPDRPGALGQVASRIGAVRGDIVGVDVLENDGGVAIDEFAVNLPHRDLVPMLVREVEEVDGASVEEVRVVGHFPDPRLDALESASRLCLVSDIAELHESLAALARDRFLADWAALLDDGAGGSDCDGDADGDKPLPLLAAAGDTPGDEMLRVLAVGLTASPLVASGESGPEDLAAAPLATHTATLLVGRDGYPFRLRERGQLAAFARIADRLWDLLG